VTQRVPQRQASTLPRQSLSFARRPALNVKAVGSFLPRLTARAFEKFGFSTAQLITDWASIAGREVAAISSPERLKWPPRPQREIEAAPGEAAPRQGATLVLRVAAARALEIDYKRRQILERINAHFGYAAVTELRLVQAPLPLPRPRQDGRTPAPSAPPEVAGIADEGLRAALCKLGCNLRGP